MNYITEKEAAELLETSVEMIQTLYNRGVLSGFTCGKEVSVDVEEVLEHFYAREAS